MPESLRKWLLRRVAGTLLLLPCLSFLAACSHFSSGNATADFPKAEQFQQIYQAKLMAAAHWKIIARNEADRIAAKFAPQSSFTVADDDPRDPTPNASRFGVAYRQMLTSGLIADGMRVFDSDADFSLSYHLAVIEHRPRSQLDTPAGLFSGVGGRRLPAGDDRRSRRAPGGGSGATERGGGYLPVCQQRFGDAEHGNRTHHFGATRGGNRLLQLLDLLSERRGSGTLRRL